MTPEEFHETVLPAILSAWDEQCFCASPGFQKLVSFDFRDYGIGPTGLADSEILIQSIIRDRFKQQERRSEHEISTQVHLCPQCKASCTERYEEYSINMYQSSVTYDRHPNRSATGLYLVGFYGFRQREFALVHDFQRAATVEQFVREVTVAV